MKKTLFLVVIFAAFAGMAFWLVTRSDDKTTVLATERNFAISDVQQIEKIFLADRDGGQITLVRDGESWSLNDRYRANSNVVDNLLQTLHRVRVRYTPARAATENIVRDIATNNITVEVYGHRNRLLKRFYVGGVTNDEGGTYMMMDGAEQPMVTHIPGFDGTLRVRFPTVEMKWRDKSIFAETPTAIQSVQIDYPKQKNKSFRLDRTNGTFTIRPFYNTIGVQSRPVASGTAQQFLQNFDRLIGENFVNELAGKDSIRQQLPFAIVTVEERSGKKKEVRLFPIFKRNRQGEYILDANGQPFAEKYFADVNGADFMLTQHRLMRKILWTYEGFLNESSGS